MSGFLRDAGRLLAPAVAEALDALPAESLTAADVAVARLARASARTIDEAAVTYQIAMELLDELAGVDEDYGGYRRIERTVKAIEHAEILANLGPKLLAALQQLGATPAARAAQAGGKPAAGSPVRGLASLRAARGSA